MSEGPQASVKPRRNVLAWALVCAALAGVAAVLYIIVQASTKPAPVVHTEEAAAAPKSDFAAKLVTPKAPTPPPDYVFYDASGKAMKIADLKGKVVVMNVWATWCAPCKIEMPTLAKLAAEFKGKPVAVVPISIDTPEAAANARLFIAQNGPLDFYHDREMKLPFKIGAAGAPTTVIYGRDGLEVARVAGEADWSGPEAKALIDKALAAD
ncbi:MAG: redoxin domain-containing protein [Phenylobacterium sp.]|uniref:TlpA family protein disulfide reductase n=1 Tax=Phenylobacterium sp. TaxID=1871053 RepID=UPI0025F412A8|nr:TlpA disulfide reductase family protein [Phenylobacterium sp.]MBI1200403.1 redoxin domain-containing protein [Phenylobacterium sp.]